MTDSMTIAPMTIAPMTIAPTTIAPRKLPQAIRVGEGAFQSPSSLSLGLRQALGKASIEDGSQLIELALVLPLLLAVFVGAVDFGRAYFLSMEVASAAEAGAMYGITNPPDTAGMQTAALADAPDLPAMTTTAIYGSECADGSSPVLANNTPPSGCPIGLVQFVEVDTTATYQPILYYPGFQSAFTLTGKSRMRATF